MERLSPMMKQYHDIKRQNPGVLLFFRLGDFYEMFFEDAILASRALEITLTSRNNDGKGKPIPMCGVPHHSVKNYLARLIKQGHKVALCEQVEDPRLVKGIVRREVTRVVTPGTVVEAELLESKENNFLASLYAVEGRVAASFLDVSTGEFWVSEFSGPQAWSQLEEELCHFRPREIILPQGSETELMDHLSQETRQSVVQTPREDWVFDAEYSRRVLLEHFSVATLEGFGLNGQSAAISSGGALLSYVKETQRASLGHITEMRLLRKDDYLQLDETTVRNLELVKGQDGSRRWTLLSALDHTQTSMGGRLLRHWLLRPLLDLEKIGQRQDAVGELQSSVLQMDSLGKVLSSIQDLERLLGRVILGTANARDLLALKVSLRVLPELSRTLTECRSEQLRPPTDFLDDLVQLLERAISESAPVLLNEGGIIASGFDSALDELRQISSSGKSFIASLEARERERTGIASLKVKYNRVFGYFIEVTKAHLESVPEDYTRRQTLVGAERFVTPELKSYEEKVLTAEERIFDLEKELFLEVRQSVAQEARRIQKAARLVARLDVLLSLATAARRHKYVRPRLDQSGDLDIRDGRHPVLELQGGEPFVPNTLFCNISSDQLLILTGPNMGGKSTYLRQNALIVILAQIGSFVPADQAQIGLVDRIFTRVGASDNLARGQSTFMVEMIETANILNSATERSLILLDEVGRGTATFDGLSIAWAVAEFLLTESSRRARTLFATHYQELTQLERIFDGVKNYQVTIRESNGQILFFHRVMPGVASKSYGIEVARLAGLPAQVVERAREILLRLERKRLDLSGGSQGRSTTEVFDELQKTLF